MKTKLIFLFISILFISLIFNCYNSYAYTNVCVLEISGENSIEVGKTLQLSANQFWYTDPEMQTWDIRVDETDGANWVSSDTSIATISSLGLVTGIKPGTVTISATCTNMVTGQPLTDTFQVTIKEATSPIEWTDVSDVSFSIERRGTEFYNYNLIINGLSKKEGHEYFAFVTNTPTLSSDILANPYGSNEKHFFSSTDAAILINNNIENNGDIYVWLYEQIYNTSSKSFECNARISARKVERPAHLSLGLRMQTYFFDKDTSLFVKEFPVSDGRKYHIKIGNITNLEILRAIRDEKSGSFTSLLNYAKSATSPLYDNSFTYTGSGTKYPAVSNSLPLVDDGFYYVYMYLEDEGGKYYPLEDIGLYQALVGDTVGKNLTDYFTNKDKFNWDALGSETPTEPGSTPTQSPTQTPTQTPTPNPSDPTAAQTPLPNTGNGTLIIGFIIILASGIFAYFKFQKYKEIK